jgi:uncharacterized peroxidase-related enzyme
VEHFFTPLLYRRYVTTSQLSTNLPLVEEDQASPEVAALYEHFRRHFDRPKVSGILKCFATHPVLLRHMMEMAETIVFADGYLVRRHKEMIATLVSTQNHCAYCADSHGYHLRMNGGSADALCAIQQNDLVSPSLTKAEQQLLRFAEKVNNNSSQITRDDIDNLGRFGWTELQISEAIHIAALFATYNRVANSFGLKSQELLSLYAKNSGDTVTPESVDANKSQL